MSTNEIKRKFQKKKSAGVRKNLFKFSFEFVSFVNFFSDCFFLIFISYFFSLHSVIMFSLVKFEKQKQSCLTFRRNYSLNLLYFLIFLLFHLFCGAVIVLAYYLLFNILFIVLFSIRKYLNTNTRNELECFSLFIFFSEKYSYY